MREFKGTKGEWKAERNNAFWEVKTEVQQDSGRLAVNVFHFNKYSNTDDEKAEANAKLIAAAPELLKALQELLSEDRVKTAARDSGENSTLNDKIRQAEKLINKAL